MKGLAIMAARLATQRTNSVCESRGWWLGVTRATAEADPAGYPASAEYYRIIDRISRGEKP